MDQKKTYSVQQFGRKYQSLNLENKIRLTINENSYYFRFAYHRVQFSNVFNINKVQDITAAFIL